MTRAGAVELNAGQIERLTRAALTVEPGDGRRMRAGARQQGLRRPGRAGAGPGRRRRRAGREPICSSARPTEDHPFVQVEQMMPFIPVVRVACVGRAIEAAVRAEHGYRHTAIIHSANPETSREDGPRDQHDDPGAQRRQHRGAGPRERGLPQPQHRHADGRGHHDTDDLHPPADDHVGRAPAGVLIRGFVYIARIEGTLTSTVKHPSLAGARLLIGQRIGTAGEAVGEPQVLVDPIGARRGNRVLVTTDGDHARMLLHDQRTPARLVVLGIVDETFVAPPDET